MERRRAVIAAATASLTLLAGAAAISLNTGIVGASGDDGVGQISPVDATTPSTTYVDAPASDDPTAPPADDDQYDDDQYDDRSDDHGEGEYEGADDDD